MDIKENSGENTSCENILQSESKTTKYKKVKKPYRLSVGSVIVIVLFAVLFTFQTTYVVLTASHKLELNKVKSNVSDFEAVLEAYGIFKENCVYDIDAENLSRYMLYAFAAEDKYSSYLTYEEFLDMYYTSAGNASGVGIYINEAYDGILVSYVMSGSPAEKAGIKMGDVIVAINGKLISDVGYDNSVTLTAGNIGDQKIFTIRRGEEKFDLTVTLGEYTPETVLYHMIEENGEKLFVLF